MGGNLSQSAFDSELLVNLNCGYATERSVGLFVEGIWVRMHLLVTSFITRGQMKIMVAPHVGQQALLASHVHEIGWNMAVVEVSQVSVLVIIVVARAIRENTRRVFECCS